MHADETKHTQEPTNHEGIKRRDFLKGAAFGAVGMMPIMTLFGCAPESARMLRAQQTAKALTERRRKRTNACSIATS